MNRNRVLVFSDQNVRNIFSSENCSYNDFSNLMFDTAQGKEKVTKEAANKRIREINFSILGVDPDCSKKELRRAIRRNKVAIYELLEDTVDSLLQTGWTENPFFEEFVEVRNIGEGDENEFYVQDDTILTVADLSGGHHDIVRQKLGVGDTYRVKTSWYGLKIYTEYELFMAGRIDWAGFVQKIYEAVDKKVNDLVYPALMDAATKVVPTSQFNKTGALTTSTMSSLIELVEDVETANGCEAVIMGTKTALSKLNALVETQWISDQMKEDRRTYGRLGIWEGIRLVEIPQTFANNDTTTKLVDNTKLLVMPVADNKFIKVVNEGDAQIKEVTDSAENMDMTIEYEYQIKMGVGTVINRKFGMWTITG